MQRTLILALTFLFSLQAFALKAKDFPTGSKCMKDYRNLRNLYIGGVAFFPITGAAELFGGAMASFSYEYGGFAALRATQTGAAIAGPVLNYVLPLTAVASTVALETFSIVELIQYNRAFRLLKDAYGMGNGRVLRTVIASIQKSHPELSSEFIRTQIIDADQSGDLCNGKWSLKKEPKDPQQKIALIRRVANINDIKKHLVQNFASTQE